MEKNLNKFWFYQFEHTFFEILSHFFGSGFGVAKSSGVVSSLHYEIMGSVIMTFSKDFWWLFKLLTSKSLNR